MPIYNDKEVRIKKVQFLNRILRNWTFFVALEKRLLMEQHLSFTIICFLSDELDDM